MADTPETLLMDAMHLMDCEWTHEVQYHHRHQAEALLRYAPLAETMARGLAAPALVEPDVFRAAMEPVARAFAVPGTSDYGITVLLKTWHDALIRAALAQTPEATDAR